MVSGEFTGDKRGSIESRTEVLLLFGVSSLIALSLIMAISRFKPAPIYIFDEIDAALDLNMTSNLYVDLQLPASLRPNVIDDAIGVDCLVLDSRELNS